MNGLTTRRSSNSPSYNFEDLGLHSGSPDEEIYARCLEVGAILVTGDRTTRDGPESLEKVIDRLAHGDSAPVLTIADQVRLLRDPEYRLECAFNMLDYLSRIGELGGTRRIYLK